VIDERLIADCIHCGFCLPTCPTYGPLWQQEMDSPRGRIHLMNELVQERIPLSATVVEHFDRCLGCMACVTACPSGVKYDRLIEQTREYVEERYEREPSDWLVRAAIFRLFPHPARLRRALAFAPLGRRLPLPGRLGALASLAPPWASQEAPPPRTKARAPVRVRVGLLLGCVQRVVFGDVNTATARVLAAEGCDVIAPPAQECCGALHLHAGRRDEGLERARALGDLFRREQVDALVVNAAGCGSHLKDADIGVRVVDVSEYLAELGPRTERRSLPLRVAFQDSCHLAHAQGIRDAPRALLGSIPGVDVAEPADQAICCGSAGIYNVVQPGAARELGDRKAQIVLETRPEAYASANPGCLIQVSTALRRAGRPLPSVHPVEILDASLRGVSRDEFLARVRM
jgi:glycolate oxidase iron-sulfur subunit